MSPENKDKSIKITLDDLASVSLPDASARGVSRARPREVSNTEHRDLASYQNLQSLCLSTRMNSARSSHVRGGRRKLRPVRNVDVAIV